VRDGNPFDEQLARGHDVLAAVALDATVDVSPEEVRAIALVTVVRQLDAVDMSGPLPGCDRNDYFHT
jgi:hypothetical protein